MVVLAILVGGKSPPTKVERVAQAPVVRVIAVPQVDLAPMALGYGVVQPARVWTAVAQVAGRVIETHPRLDDGEFVKEGELLVRIDPVDYELALAEAQAQLAELEVQAINAAASLALEERSLALAEDELARNRSLADKGTASKSAADQAERTSLTASTAVQNMRNTLALIPTQRHLLEARIDQVRLDIERTAIRAPFDLRLAKVKVELAQYVPVGSSLLEGDSLDRVEVVAQVPMGAMRRLFLGRDLEQAPALGTETMRAELGAIGARVELELGDIVAEWEGRLERISDALDADTRTVGVVVSVDRPYDQVIPGYRPPLAKGMFVKAVLHGRPRAGSLLVPRSAVRNGTVLIADADDRLRRRPVTVLFSQAGVSVIGDGLAAGDRVLVSDPIPAVEGMALRPELDTALAEALLARAGGKP